MARKELLRKIAAAVFIGMAVALFFWGRTLRTSQSHRTVLLSDSDGIISLVVCNVNSARHAVLRNSDLINHTINTLPSRINVVLTTNDPNAFVVTSNPWPERVRFLNLPPSMPITIWPQDPFVVLSGSKECRLLISRTFERAEDRQMAIKLAEYLGWKTTESDLSFEGGNIVSDNDYAFIGANTIRHNAIEHKKGDEQIVRRFERELGRRVIVIGPVPQPIGHIDMMLTPVGNKKLIIADSNWGARIAEEELNNRPEAVRDFERKCERLFFGHESIGEITDANGRTIKRPEVAGRTVEAIEDSIAIGPQLDRVAQQLGNFGYEVTRIPFLSVRRAEPNQAAEPQGTDANEPTDNKAKYPELTYNNVIVETDLQGKTVYLPQYGWPAFDNAARKVWEGLDYEVRPIGDFSISSMYGGSLRCCIKVLQREK